LYDYRSKFGEKALHAVYIYLWNQRENKNDLEMDVDELANLANHLLENRDRFIFKGMEDDQKVSCN
jgi:hypothetical protein